jgi:hypothetical protein
MEICMYPPESVIFIAFGSGASSFLYDLHYVVACSYIKVR